MYSTLIFTDGSIARNLLLNKNVGIAGFMFMSLTNTDSYVQPWRSEFMVSSKNELDINRLELGAMAMAMHCISFYVPHKISIFTDSNAAYNIIVKGHPIKNDEIKTLSILAEQGFKRLISLGFDVSFVLCKSHADINKQCKYLVNHGIKLSTWSAALINAGNTMIDQYVNSIAKYGDLTKLEQYNEDDPIRPNRAITT